MITDLRIRNFAIIDKLDLKLDEGLLVFTGETGAGKSIIMDAVEMMMGGRADSSVIRSEADEALVESTFKLNGPVRDSVQVILKREDLLDDPDYVTLTREIRREGRNIARVNGRTVNLSLLKELGEVLVDIHGQSEHLSLLHVQSHLGLLDRFAGVEELHNEYLSTFTHLASIRQELEELRKAQADAEHRTEMLTFQADEIEAARLQPGEDEQLRQEHDRLANAESLASLAQQALTALDEGTPESPAATDLIGQVVEALSGLGRIDTTQEATANQAYALAENLADLARQLRTYLETVEFNPKRLEETEERINLVHNLLHKYGGSIESANNHAIDARRQLEHISNASGRITELEALESADLGRLAEQGMALSQKRKEAAQELSQGIEVELDDLRMAQARFAVDFQTRADPEGVPVVDGPRLAFDSTGLDKVEFLVAPNPGEGLKPLVKIASGGETSRLMLALKNVLARADQIPSLIFDEIDQGIGGRVGAVVGEKLWNLGRQHQVFCVTHLPQLASFGDAHWQVQKEIKNERTLTKVTRLEGETRTLELAQMLGEVSEGTLRSAHDILQSAEAFKKEASG